MDDSRRESNGISQPLGPQDLSDDAPRPNDGGEDETVKEENPMGFKQGYKLSWRW